MPRARRLRRGIHVLPTMFTVGNLFCGYSSAVQSSIGNLELAALLVIVAAVLDGLDGRIARLTGTTTEFGLEFDSLADVISFGIAPALLAYNWALRPSRIGWSLAFVYLVCAAMRLARFNLRTAPSDKRYFVGLPSPMAGAVVAALVYAFPEPTRGRTPAVLCAALVFVVAVLMISRIRYRSFREADLRSRRSYVYVLPMAAVLVAIALHPETMLLLLSGGYLLSGPVALLWALLRRRGSPTTRLAVEAGAPGVEVVDEPAIR